ncbi:MAG TPA: sirohydrochlorin cobaltochelatase [Methanothrix sp.]|nr:sirohydrochlorin cobaltochelatase [Methanothrix sp.]
MPPATPAILLAAFGSLEPRALATYDALRESYLRAAPGSEVRLAFTSDLMRHRLAEQHGISFPSPLAALAELHGLGHRSAVVQSLQVVPGEEFHSLASLVSGLRSVRNRFAFERLEVGLPLLTSPEDCRKVSAALAPVWERAAAGSQALRADEEAVMLVGHGTGHAADSLYSLMAQVLQKDHRNVFLGTIEGFQGPEDLAARLKGCGAKRVQLWPFLLVAGGHAVREIAGDDPSSWKSILEREGFEVQVHLQGLAENGEIVAIFLEHTRRALERIV